MGAPPFIQGGRHEACPYGAHFIGCAGHNARPNRRRGHGLPHAGDHGPHGGIRENIPGLPMRTKGHEIEAAPGIIMALQADRAAVMNGRVECHGAHSIRKNINASGPGLRQGITQTGPENARRFRRGAECPECRTRPWQCVRSPCQRHTPSPRPGHSPPP